MGNTTPMKSKIDCGYASAANHGASVTGRDSEECYQDLLKFDRQPSLYPFCDFWDSPARQKKLLEHLSEEGAGPVPVGPFLVPCVALIRKGLFTWHWITILSITGKDRYAWHTGTREETTKTIEEVFPGTVVVMALAIGSDEALPWYWRFWGFLTSPIQKLF
jgi:hypothetical protein